METLTLLVHDTDDTPLENVRIRLYSEDGATFITEGDTDEEGLLVLDLPLATYWVRPFLQGYRFDTRLRVVFDEAGTWEVEGTNLVTYPPATRAGYCRVRGRIVSPQGLPVGTATVSFRQTLSPRLSGNEVVAPGKVIVSSAATGLIDVELQQKSVLEVVLEGYEDESIRVRVPELSSVPLGELLFPVVESALFSENALALDVLEEVTLQLTLTLSNGNVLPYDLDGGARVVPSDWVTLSVENPDRVSVTMDAEGVVTLVGAASGVTTLSVTVREGVSAERLPAITPLLGSCVLTIS